MWLLCITTWLIFVVIIDNGQCQMAGYQPEQVHLAYGNSVYDITVTWSTMNDTKESVCEYGINGIIEMSVGNWEKFVDGGPAQHTQYIHRVYLENLQPASHYVYHCGSKFGWSDQFSFRTPPSDGSWQPYLAIFGDMGNENAQSLGRLQKETQREVYDAILHVGDFAYDMDSDNGHIGDAFMRQIEPIAAYVPYMTCPGNHEAKYNFSNYKARFSMPGPYESQMYSFDMGPMHIISISTEFYYFLFYGLKCVANQFHWLKNDLARANEEQARSERPWIIVMGHRPMYCSNNDSDDCTNHQTYTRVGLPFLHLFGLETLFCQYGVDLLIWAHEHSYERLWPIFNYRVYNGSRLEPYKNPKAPIHIITGSAGCKEDTDKFVKNRPEWSAFASTDYGYTRMKTFNTSHLYIEQVSDVKDGAIIDQFWIIKDHHNRYSACPSKIK